MEERIHERICTANVWWDELKFHVPVYLVKGEENALVDAGPPQRELGGLAAALAPFGVTPGGIGKVLLTHGHVDHIGGLPEVQAAGPVQIHIHGEDAFFLQNHDRAFEEFYGVRARLSSNKDDFAEQKRFFLKGAGPDFDPDRVLSDGDRIDLGDGVQITAVHLPGHSMGSVGYHWEKEGILIAGDSIPALGGPDGSLPIIFDLAHYRTSIDRLLGMPLRTLVFTHGYRGLRLPPSTVRRGDEIREYLLDAKEMSKRLFEVLEREAAAKEGKPFPEIVDRVIAGMPEEMGFVPLARQLSAHFSFSTVYWGLSRLDAGR
jgi:glyoxylase-like metal-dependent hydrolase (beta-lactamase superfamily II)